MNDITINYGSSMRVAKLNGRKIKIDEINEQLKDRKFNCINPDCNCEVIVAAYSSIKINSYFRAKNNHKNDCFMEKLEVLSNGKNKRRKLTKITKKWTINDIYNLIKTTDLDDEIIEGIQLNDLEISSRNVKNNFNRDKVYYILFTPTCITNNTQNKGLIHGIIGNKKITINMTDKLEMKYSKIFPKKDTIEILLISKLIESKNKRYLVFDVQSDNIEMFEIK